MHAFRYLDFGSARPAVLLIARIMLMLLFLLSGFPKMTGFSGTVHYMESVGAPLPTLAATIAVLMEVVAGLLIVVGFYTRPLAVILVLYTIGSGIIGHHYWDMSGDAVKINMINFWKNISIAGGFLLLAVAGPGPISLDKR